MQLYHFLPAQYALDDLTRGRLKLSEIANLNDPFELWCSGQGDAQIRQALRAWKGEMSKAYGMLCFCATWRSPLLWSHYADRHKGICLGCEVRDDSAAPVRYLKSRTSLRLPLTESAMQHILFTKYEGWSYEEEWRAWFRLEERDADSNHFFREFDDSISLTEVIVGPLCETTKAELVDATRQYSRQPRLLKTRLAFKSFQVVEDKRGL